MDITERIPNILAGATGGMKDALEKLRSAKTPEEQKKFYEEIRANPRLYKVFRKMAKLDTNMVDEILEEQLQREHGICDHIEEHIRELEDERIPRIRDVDHEKLRLGETGLPTTENLQGIYKRIATARTTKDRSKLFKELKEDQQTFFSFMDEQFVKPEPKQKPIAPQKKSKKGKGPTIDVKHVPIYDYYAKELQEPMPALRYFNDKDEQVTQEVQAATEEDRPPLLQPQHNVGPCRCLLRIRRFDLRPILRQEFQNMREGDELYHHNPMDERIQLVVVVEVEHEDVLCSVGDELVTIPKSDLFVSHVNPILGRV